jgi:hypothetical protein
LLFQEVVAGLGKGCFKEMAAQASSTERGNIKYRAKLFSFVHFTPDNARFRVALSGAIDVWPFQGRSN